MFVLEHEAFLKANARLVFTNLRKEHKSTLQSTNIRFFQIISKYSTMSNNGKKKTFAQWQQILKTGNSDYSNVIDRIDKANPSSDLQDHIHFKEGSALNRDGTWKHGGHRSLSRLEKEFCDQLDFKYPT